MGGFDHPRPRSSPEDMGRRRWTPRPPGTATAAAQACDLLRRPSCRRNSQEGRGGVERLPVLGGEGRRIEYGSLRVGDTGVCQCIRGSCCSRVPDCYRAICRVRMDCGVASDGRGVDRFSAVTMADRHIPYIAVSYYTGSVYCRLSLGLDPVPARRTLRGRFPVPGRCRRP